jgi:probable addiction module antidote protein
MAKTKTSKYDVAEHLRTPEEMAAYLEACLEEANGDAAFIAKALGDIARAKGMSQVAREAGLSRESLYKALSGERAPGFDTILKVIGALGIKLHAEAIQANPWLPNLLLVGTARSMPPHSSSLGILALIHTALAFIIPVFLVVHVYMTTTQDRPISSWKEYPFNSRNAHLLHLWKMPVVLVTNNRFSLSCSSNRSQNFLASLAKIFNTKLQIETWSPKKMDKKGFSMKIEWIKTEAIKPNRRCICTIDSLEQLIASIRTIGQIEPIQIWFTGEDFRIIDGEKRWRACKKLGVPKMKVIIMESDG